MQIATENEVVKLLEGKLTAGSLFALELRNKPARSQFLVNLLTGEKKVVGNTRNAQFRFSVWSYAAKGTHNSVVLLDSECNQWVIARGDNYSSVVALNYPYLALLTVDGRILFWDAEKDKQVSSTYLGLFPKDLSLQYQEGNLRCLTVSQEGNLRCRPVSQEGILLVSKKGEEVVGFVTNFSSEGGKEQKLQVAFEVKKPHTRLITMKDNLFGLLDAQRVLTTYNFKGEQVSNTDFRSHIRHLDVVVSTIFLPQGWWVFLFYCGTETRVMVWSIELGKVVLEEVVTHRICSKLIYMSSVNSLWVSAIGSSFLFDLDTHEVTDFDCRTGIYPVILQGSPLRRRVLRQVLIRRLTEYLPKDLILESWYFL